MKNLKKIGLLILLFAITLVSCKKEVDEQETKKPDGVALKNFIESKINANTQKYVVDMDNSLGTEIVGEQGTVLSFYPGQLKDKQGNSVIGNVDVELVEIYSKADMLLMNKTTMGLLPNGNHAMLVSGGQILLNAFQNGEELEIDGSLTVLFPVDNMNSSSDDMILFVKDCCDNDCNGIVCPEDVWIVEEDSAAGQGGLFVENIGGENFYYALISDFGWTNVDKFYSFTGPKTTLLVDAPEGYDHTNCAIYLSYDGEKNGLASLDKYLPETDLFTEHYGEIPIGKEVTFIIISIVEGEYSYSTKSATIVAGETIVLDALVPSTEANIKTVIENLP